MIVLCSFARIGFGSPAGANTPNQFVTFMPLTPPSSNVGTSGSAADRFEVVIAIARSRPARACPTMPGAVGNAAWIWPAAGPTIRA